MTRLPFALGAALSLLTLATPAAADQRRFGLLSFDAIDVQGDMVVEVRPDYRIAAVAEASREAIEALSLEVRDRTLYIRQSAEGAFGPVRADRGPVTIRLTAQNLRSITMRGAGLVTVERLQGDSVRVDLTGAGQLTVNGIDARDLTVRGTGNGGITLAGRARMMRASATGATSIDAAALTVEQLTARGVGSGAALYTATRTADLQAAGSYGITVTGRARCTLRNQGSGQLLCGGALVEEDARLPRTEDADPNAEATPGRPGPRRQRRGAPTGSP